MKKEELNNYHFSLTGRNLSITEFATIEILENSSTAWRHHIENHLPCEYLQNALVWHDIFVLALNYGVTVNSGYRCPELNKKVGGVETSLHQQALAVDFNIVNLDKVRIHLFLRDIECYLLENNMKIKYYYKRGNMLHVELKYK